MRCAAGLGWRAHLCNAVTPVAPPPPLFLVAEAHLQQAAGPRGILRLAELPGSPYQRQALAAALRLAAGSHAGLRAAAAAALEACLRGPLAQRLEHVLLPASGCWREVAGAHMAAVGEARLWPPQQWLQLRCAPPLLQQLSALLVAADVSDEAVGPLASWAGGPGGLWAWLQQCVRVVGTASACPPPPLSPATASAEWRPETPEPT
jgi:hypothetical protein